MITDQREYNVPTVHVCFSVLGIITFSTLSALRGQTLVYHKEVNDDLNTDLLLEF